MRGLNPETEYKPVIEFCTIRNNQTVSSGNGGGTNANEHSDPIIRNCLISGNSAQRGGGTYWGVGSEPQVEDCVIEENTAVNGGGGVFVDQFKDTVNDQDFVPRILRTRIGPDNQTIGNEGGGINIAGIWTGNTEGVQFRIENCTIVDNHADASNGGGIVASGGFDGATLQVVVANSVLSGNTAQFGGGLYLRDYVSLQSSTVTMMHNRAYGSNGGSAVFFDGRTPSSISNSIIWYDTSPPSAAQVRVVRNGLTVERCDVQDSLPVPGQDGFPPGVTSINNISANPLFVDADGMDNNVNNFLDNNYHLQAGSPANDRGSVPIVPLDILDVDVDGLVSERLPLDRDDIVRYLDDVQVSNSGVDEPPNFNLDSGAFETPGCMSDSECDDEDQCNGEEACFAGTCVVVFNDCNLNGEDDFCDVYQDYTSNDCNNNMTPDECEAGSPFQASLIGCSTNSDGSLWRSQNNFLQLAFACDVTAPTPGTHLHINKLLTGGAYDSELASSFTVQLVNTAGGRPRILKIKGEGDTVLNHQTWYGVRSDASWTGVLPFILHYVNMIGDADIDPNTLTIDASDLSTIWTGVPTLNAPESDRKDINGDGRILSIDMGWANSNTGPNEKDAPENPHQGGASCQTCCP